MSIAFKGRQMVPVLNEMGVAYACVGNHDFDFGEDILTKLVAETKPCKWLLTNVTDKRSGQPLVGSLPYTLEVPVFPPSLLLTGQDFGGVKVGLFTVIEEGWMQTLTCDTSNYSIEGTVSFTVFSSSDFCRLRRLRHQDGRSPSLPGRPVHRLPVAHAPQRGPGAP